jgi:hypothetical protein
VDADPRIEALKQALRQAVEECRAHNDDYHHRTPDHLFNGWERLLGDAGPTSGDTAGSRQEPD